MRNFGSVSNKWWIASLIAIFQIVTAAPVWADECADAKRALVKAEVAFKEAKQKLKQAEAKLKQAIINTKNKEIILDKAIIARGRANKIINSRTRSSWTAKSRLKFYPGPEALKNYEEVIAALEQSKLDYEVASKAVDKLGGEYDKAGKAEDDARSEVSSAANAYGKQKNQLEEAKENVDKACKVSARDSERIGSIFTGDVEALLDSVGLLGGSNVIKEYTGRAANANTEDIAIEEARRRGLFDDDDDGGGGGGGGVATTNATFSAQCDINTGAGTNTLSANGSAFCTVNGGAPSLGGGTANITCTPGSTVAISATCSATNCRAFVNSFTNLTCPFTSPGFITGGFGGAGGFGTNASVNCTCQ